MDKNKKSKYDLLIKQGVALAGSETNTTANLANTISLLNTFLENVNWVGFYFEEENEDLVLSHFIGKPACTRLKKNKGVCQSSYQNEKSLIVKDVHAFAGHIACDNESKSEIVIPIYKNKTKCGVLDIDSNVLDNFDDLDLKMLELYVKNVIEVIISE